jgi:hypothetical protein
MIHFCRCKHQPPRIRGCPPRRYVRPLRGVVRIRSHRQLSPGNRLPYPQIMATVDAPDGSVWNISRLAPRFSLAGPGELLGEDVRDAALIGMVGLGWRRWFQKA